MKVENISALIFLNHYSKINIKWRESSFSLNLLKKKKYLTYKNIHFTIFKYNFEGHYFKEHIMDYFFWSTIFVIQNKLNIWIIIFEIIFNSIWCCLIVHMLIYLTFWSWPLHNVSEPNPNNSTQLRDEVTSQKLIHIYNCESIIRIPLLIYCKFIDIRCCIRLPFETITTKHCLSVHSRFKIQLSITIFFKQVQTNKNRLTA